MGEKDNEGSVAVSVNKMELDIILKIRRVAHSS